MSVLRKRIAGASVTGALVTGALAQAPDGSLYIAESQKGKIWRVMYQAPK